VLEKWVHSTEDTVSAVAISDKFIAWASQKGKKYGIFLKKRLILESEALFYQTENIIQDIDFNDSQNPTKLVGVDFNGYCYVIRIIPNSDEHLLQQIDLNKRNKCPLTCITISKKDHHPFPKLKPFQDLIAVGTERGDVLFIFLGGEFETNVEVAEIQGFLSTSCGSKVLGVNFLAKCDCEESKTANEDCKEHIHLVVAYRDGHLRIFRLVFEGSEIQTKQEFDQNLRLNVEFGDVIDSSDSGDRFVVACGDKKVRVFLKVGFPDSKVRLSPRSFLGEVRRYGRMAYHFLCEGGIPQCVWGNYELNADENFSSKESQQNWEYGDCWELHASFELSAVPLAVAMSADGKRLAVGQEDSKAVICDIDSGCKIQSFDNNGRVRSVGINSNGSFLLTGGFDNKVKLFNIESGFSKTVFKNDDIIKSVSLDSQGHFLAVGTESGFAKVYEIVRSNISNNPIVSEQCKKQVYVVKLSDDGEIFAFGGYDNHATLLKIQNKGIKKIFHEGASSNEPNFIWGLDIKDKCQSYLIVVGAWDWRAYLYKFDKESLEKQACMTFPQNDRVFDVALSNNSSHLLVGGRDMKARLYQLPDSIEDGKTILPDGAGVCLFEDNDRVYCVAISPNMKYIAYGGICKNVIVYAIPQNDRPLVQFQHRHTVHRIQFADDTHFAAISEDGCCVLYSLADHLKTPVLQLSVEGTGNSLAFTTNGRSLAVAHGFNVTIYGKEHGYGVFDRPSFKVAKDLLTDPVGLRIALSAHPTLTNSFESGSRASLLSYAVETSNTEAVTMLLDSDVPSGLIIRDENNKKESALTVALQASNRTLVEKLLSAISSGKIVQTEALFLLGLFSEFWEDTSKAGSSDSKRTVFKAIAMKFPSNFLAFLKSFSLENCDVELIQGIDSAQMDEAVHVALPFKFPRAFWKWYSENKLRNQSLSPFDKRKPENILQAQRIPFPGICLPCLHLKDNHESPLEVIFQTSASLKDFSIFSEDTIVHNLVMLEWGVIGPYFTVRTLMYLVYYAFTVLLSWNLVSLSNNQNNSSRDTELRNGWTVFLSVLLILGSLYGLQREVRQFASELKLETQRQDLLGTVAGEKHRWFERWKNAFLNHFDLWNILDFCAFSTQLATDIMILFSSNHILGVAAVSMLFLTWKLYSYARAISTVGTFVRIVQRSMMAMGNFLGFLGCWLLGFAFAFYVLLSQIEGFRTLQESMFSVSLMIYGNFDALIGTEQSADHDILVYIMFQLMMLSSVVIMLNLLIAILSDSYQDVKQNALEESVFQLASIILELRKIDGNSIDTESRRKGMKWVHVLKPSVHKGTNQSVCIATKLSEIETTQKEILARLDLLQHS